MRKKKLGGKEVAKDAESENEHGPNHSFAGSDIIDAGNCFEKFTKTNEPSDSRVRVYYFNSKTLNNNFKKMLSFQFSV